MKNILVLMCLLILAGCGQLPPDKYVRKVTSDERYVKQYRDSVFKASCQYCPPELLGLMEFRKDHAASERVSGDALKKYANAYVNGLYFKVRLGLNDRQNLLLYGLSAKADYSTRVFYLNGNMTDDFLLTDDRGHVSRAQEIKYYNSYGASPDVDLLVVFPKAGLEEANQIRITYRDKIFGISSEMVFGYEVKGLLKPIYVVKTI
jgi:hypothetical protein